MLDYYAFMYITITNLHHIKQTMTLLLKIRKEKGVNQETIATRIGVSRQTYSHIEKGDSDLTLWQAVILSEYFDIAIDSLLPTHAEISQKTQFNREKYKQIIKNFIHLGGADDGKITKTKLAKLCYLLDFAWYYKHLEAITGLEYRKIQQWPVPDIYFTTIEELQLEEEIAVEQKWSAYLISTIGEVEHSLLSKEEFSLLKAIALKRKEQNTQQIVDFTHQQLPRMMCYDKEIIPYELITQEDPDHVY